MLTKVSLRVDLDDFLGHRIDFYNFKTAFRFLAVYIVAFSYESIYFRHSSL